MPLPLFSVHVGKVAPYARRRVAYSNADFQRAAKGSGNTLLLFSALRYPRASLRL